MVCSAPFSHPYVSLATARFFATWAVAVPENSHQTGHLQ
jgi:hypothetical protein